MSKPFLLGVATGPTPRKLVSECLQQLGSVRGEYQLGFIYAHDTLGEDMGDIVGRLKQETGIQNWVGTLGLGVCSTGVEYYDKPTLLVMLADIDATQFSIIGTDDIAEEKLLEEVSSYCKEELPHVGVIHGDPSNPATPNIIEKISEAVPSAYLVGGLTSSNTENYQVANEIIKGSVSGIFFSPEVNTVIGHTQGCTPLDQQHVITKSDRNLLLELDDRPALDVLRDDVGEVDPGPTRATRKRAAVAVSLAHDALHVRRDVAAAA